MSCELEPDLSKLTTAELYHYLDEHIHLVKTAPCPGDKLPVLKRISLTAPEHQARIRELCRIISAGKH